MKVTIRKRMQDIARKEGISIEDNAMDTLIESVGNDIRQVLNALQMISRSKSKVSIRYSDMKERIKTISKDSILRMTPFTGVQQVFNRKVNFNQRYEAFFVDYSLIPLMVQENYPNVLQNSREISSGQDKIEILKEAADCCADSDLLSMYLCISLFFTHFN